MSHFAKLDDSNFVVYVTVGKDDDDEKVLSETTGEKYVQTSYNTRGGVHYNGDTWQPSEDQSKALRKNFAAVGYYYDEQRDAFIPPKLYDSWLLNENTCLWDPPKPRPTDEKNYFWNEDELEWIEA